MRLLPLSPEHLESQPTLPFDLYDARGRLLLRAGEALDCRAVRTKVLALESVYGEGRAVEGWLRRLAEAVSVLVDSNAPLRDIARARPAGPEARSARWAEDDWDHLPDELDTVLRDPGPDTQWLSGLKELHARVRQQTAARLDEALFHFIYSGGRDAERYHGHQALRCMLVGGEVARELQWDAGFVESLELAALTMNMTMRRLQDQLANVPVGPLNRVLRKQIDHHGADAAELLQDCGVHDAHWLTAVRRHHDAGLETLASGQLGPGERMALVLRRVDIYCAKLSRRAGRSALSSLQAASQVCLGADGRPDRIGSVLLRATGLYPPGSHVKLGSDELGIVLSRGARADQPLAAVLVNARGEVLFEPRLRDTALPGLGVCAALRPEEVPVRVPPSQLRKLHLSIRAALPALDPREGVQS